MRRLFHLLVLVCVLALALPVAASAAERMYVGFQDDRSFRWADDHVAAIERAARAGATVIKTTVYWSEIAPRRPQNAGSPFDSTYRFDDLDAMVREAQARGIEVMLAIWGTPEWANGGKGRNYLPNRLSDLTAFSRALATRYSGRYAAYPFVRFYTIGNEPNLDRFLAPQYDSSGRSVGPLLYARMYRAAYAGIKAGSPNALVAIGETSPRGRDKPSPGTAQDSHSPGRFAEMIARVKPRLQFDAWAHHPYPTAPHLGPAQRVRWPNVTLTQLPRFERSLNRWFGREVPIWITEYGHETRPQEPRGVSRSAQAAYARQALLIARKDDAVEMFIWFMLRDDFSTSESWQSGLFDRRWVRKPAYSPFAALARAADARNAVVEVRGGRANPLVRVSALEVAAHADAGDLLGVTYRLFERRRPITVGQPAPALGRDGWVAFRVDFTPARGRTYDLEIEIEDINGNLARRRLTLVGI